jgi:hypothetical protein
MATWNALSHVMNETTELLFSAVLECFDRSGKG